MNAALSAEAGVFLAGLLAGMTGFGFNLLSTPFLLLTYEPRSVVVRSLFFGLIASGSLLLLPSIHRQIDLRLMGLLFGFSLLGLPLGVLLFAVITPDLLRQVIGAVTVGYALLSLIRANFRFSVHRYLGAPAGILSGVLSVSTGLSGPPAVVFVHAQRLPQDPFRATLAAYVFLVTLVSLPILWIGGFVDLVTIEQTLPLVPSALIGLALGMALFSRLSSLFFDRLVLGGLMAMGILSIVSAAH